ncbi:PAS domain S-box protein, partial [Candidatus Bathyarchaeota archaeon]|nr:PAS domain S-box protein [Candidatus Bathyarchaeota archaeon]
MIERADIKDPAEKFRISDEYMKIFFDYAPDAYYLLDSEGTLIDANMAAERLTGYRKEEFIGRKIVESGILPQDYISKAVTILAKNLLGEPSGPDEFVLNRKDGGKVVVEISTYPIEVEGKKLILGIAHDITERKNMERKIKEYSENLESLVKRRTGDLEKTTKFLEMIIENVPDLMYIKDRDLRYVLVNESFCK